MKVAKRIRKTKRIKESKDIKDMKDIENDCIKEEQQGNITNNIPFIKIDT